VGAFQRVDVMRRDSHNLTPIFPSWTRASDKGILPLQRIWMEQWVPLTRKWLVAAASSGARSLQRPCHLFSKISSISSVRGITRTWTASLARIGPVKTRTLGRTGRTDRNREIQSPQTFARWSCSGSPGAVRYHGTPLPVQSRGKTRKASIGAGTVAAGKLQAQFRARRLANKSIGV